MVLRPLLEPSAQPCRCPWHAAIASDATVACWPLHRSSTDANTRHGPSSRSASSCSSDGSTDGAGALHANARGALCTTYGYGTATDGAWSTTANGNARSTNVATDAGHAALRDAAANAWPTPGSLFCWRQCAGSFFAGAEDSIPAAAKSPGTAEEEVHLPLHGWHR